ncbi:hypothetical protein [Leptospira perolatii]|nr:hypothetical protein [Leptospira perolatii]
MKRLSVLSTAVALTAVLGNCDGGKGGGNNNAVLAALVLANQFEANVFIAGKVTKTGNLDTTSTTVTSNTIALANGVDLVTNKPMYVTLTNTETGEVVATDFTVALAPSSNKSNKDAGDFGVSVNLLGVPSGTYTGKIITIDSTTVAGACNATCDSVANYNTDVATFSLAINVDESNPGSLSQVTVSSVAISPEITADASGHGGSATTVNIQIKSVLAAIKGQYFNPNPTAGETVCDGFNAPAPEVLSGTITSNKTLGPSTILDGVVYVKSGATLTVPAGSVVYGTRGSAIFFVGGNLTTQGTAAAPVCFTSSQARGSRFPGDWGGIVFVGSGSGTRATGTGTTEGVSPETYPKAGGTNVNLNLAYTIVEFAGNEVAPGDELNSLSHYAVNSATYNYVQAHRGLDDSYEWWGGGIAPSTFTGTYLIGSGGMDDDFDMDEGFSGTLSNLIAVKYPTACGGSVSTDPHGMEMDGAHNGYGATCLGGTTDCSHPTVSNYTLIGINAPNSFGERHREGMAGTFSEGVIYGFSENVHCDASAGYPATTSTIAASVHSEQAKSDNIAGSTCTGASADDITALPIESLGGISATCGFGDKPDFTTKSTGTGLATADTGGGPASGPKWWQGWTAWRSR